MKNCNIALVLGILVSATPGRTDVKLPAIFSDHLVLQSAEAVPV